MSSLCWGTAGKVALRWVCPGKGGRGSVAARAPLFGSVGSVSSGSSFQGLRRSLRRVSQSDGRDEYFLAWTYGSGDSTLGGAGMPPHSPPGPHSVKNSVQFSSVQFKSLVVTAPLLSLTPIPVGNLTKCGDLSDGVAMIVRGRQLFRHTRQTHM